MLVDVHQGTKESCYWSYPTPDHGVGVVLSGNYTSELSNAGRWQKFAYCPGDICLHQRDESRRRRFSAQTTSEFHTALVYLPETLIQDAHEHYRGVGQPSRVPNLRSIVRDLAVTQVTASLVAAMGRQVGELYAEVTASWLAAHLVTNHSECSQSARRHAESITDPRLRRVLELIAHRYTEPLTLEDLASEACVSKFHFARMFRLRTGSTPHDYLTSMRLRRASELLEQTDLPVSVVGSSAGFTNAAHFSRSFTLKHGISPRAFRRKASGIG